MAVFYLELISGIVIQVFYLTRITCPLYCGWCKAWHACLSDLYHIRGASVQNLHYRSCLFIWTSRTAHRKHLYVVYLELWYIIYHSRTIGVDLTEGVIRMDHTYLQRMGAYRGYYL